jgi:upstream activation factor subunit UAF30
MASHVSKEQSMPNAALSQKLKPSKQLAVVLGSEEPVSRADAVKGIWDYVKQHNLQNPENRREILADENLKPLFGKDKITMFEVGKIVNSNLESERSSKIHTRKAA